MNAAYLIGTFQFSRIPTGTTPLITVDNGAFADIFLGGWWNGAANQNNIAGRTVAFTGLTNAGVPATVFGSNIFNRSHSQVYHNLFATAAFMHVSNILDEAKPFVTTSTSTTADDMLLVDLNFVATDVQGSNAVITEQLFKISNNPAAPIFNAETAVTDGWQVVDGPVVIDAARNFIHWYAVNSYGISSQGNLNFGFAPIINYEASAVVTQRNGNSNDLTVTVTEFLKNGDTNVLSETFSIRNNSEGTFQVGRYMVFVSTSGNTQINNIEIVEVLDVEIIPPVDAPVYSAFVTQRNGNSNDLTITVNGVSETFSIRNNSSGTFNVNGFSIFVSTQGNTNINAIFLVE